METVVKKRRGFTLIELLVVIAIIALLAAILFPVFGRARSNARRSACQSNLKQIGLAVHQYSQDYDEFVVPFSTNWQGASVGSGADVYFPELLFPYIKNAQIFQCPEDPYMAARRYFYNDAIQSYSYGPSNPQVNALASTLNVPFGSYAMNALQATYNTYNSTATATSCPTGLSSGASTATGYINLGATQIVAPATGLSAQVSIKESAVQSPATKIMMFDTVTTYSTINDNYNWNNMGVVWYYCSHTDAPGIGISSRSNEGGPDGPSGAYTRVSSRHFSGYNALFGDGHVKWRKFGSSTASDWFVTIP